MNFIDKLLFRLDSINSHLCVGLDSQYDKVPLEIKKGKKISQAIFEFNKKIVQVTNKISVAYKINISFYEAYGFEGIRALYRTTWYIKQNYPEIILLADCKRAEIGRGAIMLRRQIIDWLNFDCIMITPWFGYDAVKEFVKDNSVGVSIYVHDSNPSAPEFQDLKLNNGKFLYEFLAQQIINKWNKSGNIIVEIGATYPKQLKRVRQIVGKEMPILTVGIGAQGGKIENLRGAFGKNNRRLIVSVSRGIILAGVGKKDYFDAVKRTAEKFRNNLLKISMS